jgi:hypothetical protein
MGDNQDVKTVPIAEGDPAWVFPEEVVTSALAESLSASSDRVRQVATLLPAGRAGWSGSGLEYWLYPSGKRCLSGVAENPQVSFTVDLIPPDFYPGASSSDWQVTADISVRCDAEADWGMHAVESCTPQACREAEDAVAAVETATRWLLDRCRAVPPADWRTRDPRSGHT